MILAFSGQSNWESIPERVLHDKKPAVMINYLEINERVTAAPRRFKKHKKRRRKQNAEDRS